MLSILQTDKPDFEPGTQWAYSNANYTLLAAVVARAAGLDEASFLQANVFGPLQMTASGFGYAAQQRPGLATPYYGTTSFQPQPVRSLDLFAGAGGMVSNAPDMAAWDVALMSGSLLDATSMHALWSPGALSNGTPVAYAMGFEPASIGGHREVWHNGLTPGAGGYCYNAIFPNDKLAVIVLSNGYDFSGVPEGMVTQVLAAYDPHVLAAAPGEDPAVTARAKDWLARLQSGNVDPSMVTPGFAKLLTPNFVAQVKASLAGSGTATGWTYLGSQAVPGATVYRYRIVLGGVPHIWMLGLAPDGKIAGSRLQ